MKGEATGRNGSRSPVPKVANLGIVRPPFVYAGAIVLGLLVHIVWRRHILPPFIGAAVGAPLTLAAAALFIYAVRTFRAAGTPVPGTRPPPRLFAQARIASAGTRSILLFHFFNSDSRSG